MRTIKSRLLWAAGATALAIVAAATLLFAAADSGYPLGSVVAPDVFRVVKEDDSLRLMIVTHQPHSRTPWYSRPAMAYYYLDSCKIARHFADGVTKTGNPAAGHSGLEPGLAQFSFENTGDTVCRIVVVERK